MSVIENGIKNGLSTVCGSTVTFHCFAGYDLVGNSSISCLQNGNWSSSQPYCFGEKTEGFCCFLYDVFAL